MNQGIDCPCCGRKTQKRGDIEQINEFGLWMKAENETKERLIHELTATRLGLYTLLRLRSPERHQVSTNTMQLLPDDWQKRIRIQPSQLTNGGFVYELVDTPEGDNPDKKQSLRLYEGEAGGRAGDDTPLGSGSEEPR